MTEKDIIKGLEEYLKKKYGGKIPPEFGLILEVIKSLLHRYIQVRDKIEAEGVVSSTTNARHTLLPVENNLTLALIRACKSLGISPLDSAKLIKVENAIATTEDETEDFISSLTN